MSKLLALVAAALVATATASTAAESLASPSFTMGYVDHIYGDPSDRLNSKSQIDLGNVVTSGPAVVEVYDYRMGTPGALLATKDLRAGSNRNVRVNLGSPRHADVIAVLKVDGRVASQRVYNFSRD